MSKIEIPSTAGKSDAERLKMLETAFYGYLKE